jgi:predicted  nucleic acid-binding Zn-ribbon protein
MEEAVFKTALAAVASGDYCESDIKTLKTQLKTLDKEEHSIKRKIEKETNEFVKNKDKHQTELKNIRNDIKEIKHILKNL